MNKLIDIDNFKININYTIKYYIIKGYDDPNRINILNKLIHEEDRIGFFFNIDFNYIKNIINDLNLDYINSFYDQIVDLERLFKDVDADFNLKSRIFAYNISSETSIEKIIKSFEDSFREEIFPFNVTKNLELEMDS